MDGGSLKELFELIDRESNGEYCYLLECYHKTATHYQSSLVTSILSWKKEENEKMAATKASVGEQKFRV